MMELKKREAIVKEIELLIVALKANGGWVKRTNGEGWFNHEILEDALALIKELTEEIADLEADYDRVYEQAEADIHGNMADGGTSCHWCIDGHRRDAVKQMQEKLSLHFGTYTDNDTVKVRDVFKLVGKFAEEILEENK